MRFLIGIVAQAFLCASGTAATVQVVNTSDSGGGSLRQAILDAGSGDTITFAPALNGALIRLTSGQLSISKDLTIDASALANGISISGDADSSGTPTAADSRVFNVGAFTVVFRKLKILDGKGQDGGSGSDGASGGGIYNGGNLSLIDCLVAGNRAGKGGDSTSSSFAIGGDGGEGGGIFNDGSATLTLLRTRVYQNQSGDGGAANGQGSADFTNGGDGGDGGGIFNQGTLTIVDSEIQENLAGDGGTAVNLGMSGGDGGGGEGGGIRSTGSSAHLTVRNSTVAGNETGQGPGNGFSEPGGGLSIANDGSAFIINSTIANNLMPGASGFFGGGGLFVFDTTTNIVNSTITGNSTPSGGGGIRQHFTDLVTIENTIVSGNTAGGSGNDISGNIKEGGRNFVGDTDGATGLGTPLTGDPMLGSLGDNGGPTRTMVPAEGSPVIDMALATVETPDLDQRGFVRPFGEGYDIGAVEFGSALPPNPNAALIAQLQKQIKKTKKALKRAQKAGRTAQANKLRKKLKSLQRRLRLLL